jgi:hypothetical protein
MPSHRPFPFLVFALLAGGIAPASAQCNIDFENLAVNTAVTNQYDGVTFSVLPQSCGGAPTLYMRIYEPPNGTSSGTKCLRIDLGCDFSPDYVRMVFDTAQSEVGFTLGDWASTYTIRYYSTTSGAGLIGSFNVVIPPAGGGDIGVHRRVTVASAANNIRRIEIDSTTDNTEAIDDLTFYSDLTPPIAEISVPAYEACDCDNSVSVRGRACEDDGVYEHDELYYMPVGGATWTFIDDAFSPQCTVNGALYTWNTTGIADGAYFLKMTVYNACGLSNEAVTVVYIHRNLADPVLRSPTAGAVLGGAICIDGTAYDSIGCFSYYTVDWKPVVGGAYAPVDPNHVQYTGTVINDPLASWNTLAAPVPPDGNYRIRAEAVDNCGLPNDAFVDIVVDNTAPTAVLTEPVACEHVDGVVQIRGTANDAHLASWTVLYTGGDGPAAHTWLPVPGASGNAPVVNGLLGTLDVSALPACAYTLRLVVYDLANVNCTGIGHVSEYTVAINVRGDRGDINCDGVVNNFDINPFVECLITGNCPDCP